VAPPEDVISRIVAAPPADAAALVLDLAWPQTRAVIAALGPREVARLLQGVRADRVAELLSHVSPGALPAVLANLSVPAVAELLPLVPVETAVRVVTHLSPEIADQLLLALPTQHRMVLQGLLRPAVSTAQAGGYADHAEQAVRRATGRVATRDPRGGGLLIEVFGRPVQVLVRDHPGGTFGSAELQAAVVATNWRHIVGLLVLTNAPLDPGLGAAVREARQHGYVVEAVPWLDERDDGVLKRMLVRLVG
jgi:hypothetical protein